MPKILFLKSTFSKGWWPWSSKGPDTSQAVDLENGINTIDVWWLVDDGGLSLLVPYLMSQHPYVSRLLAICNSRTAFNSFPIVAVSDSTTAFGVLNV